MSSSAGPQTGPSEPESAPAAREAASESMSGRELTVELIGAQWPAILAEVQAMNRTASSLLGQAALLTVKDDEVTIGFESEPLRDLFVKDPKKGEYLQAAMLKVLGQTVRIKCTVTPKGPSRGDSGPRVAEATRPQTAETPHPVADKPRAQAEPPTSPTFRAVSGEPAVSDKTADSYPGSDPTNDRVIREAVERFGARIGGVQRLSDGKDK